MYIYIYKFLFYTEDVLNICCLLKTCILPSAELVMSVQAELGMRRGLLFRPIDMRARGACVNSTIN